MKVLTLEKANEIMEASCGDLDLDYSEIKKLPNNLIVKGNLNLYYSDIEKLPNNLIVKKSLSLGETKIKELPTGLKIGGNIDLYYTLIKRFSKTKVNGYLQLSNSSIEELPDNLCVRGGLFLRNTPIKRLPKKLVVGGILDLKDSQIENLPSNLVVGDNLDLYDTSIKELPDNLTVGGSLDLSGTQIEKLPNDLVVGGSLFVNPKIKELPNDLIIGGEIYGFGHNGADKVKKLVNGTYVPNQYIYADGILTHVANKKQIKGYTFYKGKIAGQNIISDGKYFAHCSSFKEGVKDLDFKKAKDRSMEQYSNLTLDTIVSTKELIIMYRTITGACEQGTKHFVNSLGKELKDSYSIKEAIELTSDQYGAEIFKNFFE